jgi:hypothetical protein
MLQRDVRKYDEKPEWQLLELLHVEISEGKRKTKANFLYQGDSYKMMSVTDPEFFHIQDGTIYNDAFLIISIGASYHGRCYKFISGIFPGNKKCDAAGMEGLL